MNKLQPGDYGFPSNNMVDVPMGCTDLNTIEDAIDTLNEQRRFIEQANEVRFAVQFDGGYWLQGKDGPVTNDFTKASTFSWLEQNDHLMELMTEISVLEGASFKIICVKAAPTTEGLAFP